MTQETINALHEGEHHPDSEIDNHNHGGGHAEPGELSDAEYRSYVYPPGILGKMEEMCEDVFKVRKRGLTIRKEIELGVIQFISCLYVLPVVPEQMAKAGYDTTGSIVATATTCCIGCLIGSVLTNTPFIIAPPTSVSIFLAVFIRQQNLTRHDGNVAVMISGLLLMLIGVIRPIGTFMTRLIPDAIQASTAVGIGLITALAGATEVHLVVRGKYTILDMGELSSEVLVAISALIVVAVALHYHIKGAFCIGLFFGTIVFWLVEEKWPKEFAFSPESNPDSGNHVSPDVVLLLFDLVFLYVITLNGLARSLSDLSKLTKPDGSIPRGRWLFIVCGLTTIISGAMSGPPILISPESAAGIKAGAKTGLSTLVCGALFGLAVFFSPFFAEIPAAGTAPLLLMVGVLLFQNSKRVDWYQPRFAVPGFCCLFFIPFTYSILRGVAFGYVTYIIIGMFTGDFWVESFTFLNDYLMPPKVDPKVEEEKRRRQSEKGGDGGDAPELSLALLADPSKLVKTLANSNFFDMSHQDEYISPIMDMHTAKKIAEHDVPDESDEKALQAAANEAARVKMAKANELFAKLTNIDVANDYNPLTRLGWRGTAVPKDEAEDMAETI